MNEVKTKIISNDQVYHGRPLNWAKLMQEKESNENTKEKYKEIEHYLLAIRNINK